MDDAYNNGNSKDTDALIIIGNCATISLDSTSNPKMLAIDFALNCLCNNGRLLGETLMQP